jgi:hypothetical protein
MKRNPGIYRFLVTLVVLPLFFASSCKDDPKNLLPVDWDPYYTANKKEPFGLYVFNAEIDKLSNGFKKVERVRKTVTDKFGYAHDYYDTNNDFGILYIDYKNKMESWSVESLLDGPVYYGAHVLVSAHNLPTEYYKDVAVKEEYQPIIEEKIRLRVQGSTQTFAIDKLKDLHYFEVFESDVVEALGYFYFDSDPTKKYCNFLKFEFGMGAVYLHTTPEVFANYALLNCNTSSYVSSVLSQFKQSKLLWFTNYPNDYQDDQPEQGLLRYIKQQPALRIAWNLLWLLLLLFVLTKVKRTQRIIPVIDKKQNYSMEYTKRIAEFHLLEQNYHSLIDKEITLILEKLRNEHRMDTSVINDTFKEKLELAINCSTGVAQAFVNYLKRHKGATVAHKQDFKDFQIIVKRMNL